MENKYLIYESAITAPIEQPKRNGNIVEFITVLQEADRKNRNGRIYPKEVIDAALHSPLVQEHLRHKTLVGECGHPFSQDLARQTNVDMRNAAFRVDEFWWEGNLLKGRCRTLDTAVGRDMAGMIMDGCELSFSMRGQGNVIRDAARDALVVQPPLMLICWDWVWTPSHDVAYMEKICEETKDSFFNRTASMSLVESMNLYENGSLTEIHGESKEEKKFVDFFATYGRKYKSLNETYKYDPKDTVKEITDTYVILENDTTVMKVARNDYLLKSMRDSINEAANTAYTVTSTAINATKTLEKGEKVQKKMGEGKSFFQAVSEDCAGIAALDCPRSTDPLEPEHMSAPEVKSDEVMKTLSSDSDVKPVEDYKNPVEQKVEQELGKEAKNVSASAELTEFLDFEINKTNHKTNASDEASVETGTQKASESSDSHGKALRRKAGHTDVDMNNSRLLDINADGLDVNVAGGSAGSKTSKLRSKKGGSAPKALAKKDAPKSVPLKEFLNVKLNTTESETNATGKGKVKTGDLEASRTFDNHNKIADSERGNAKRNGSDMRIGDINADNADVNVMGGKIGNKGKTKAGDAPKTIIGDIKKKGGKGKKAAKASPALKEEFYKYYTIIAEETGLTEAMDIFKVATQYSEFMSEDCAELFREYAERGDE